MKPYRIFFPYAVIMAILLFTCGKGDKHNARNDVLVLEYESDNPEQSELDAIAQSEFETLEKKDGFAIPEQGGLVNRTLPGTTSFAEQSGGGVDSGEFLLAGANGNRGDTVEVLLDEYSQTPMLQSGVLPLSLPPAALALAQTPEQQLEEAVSAVEDFVQNQSNNLTCPRYFEGTPDFTNFLRAELLRSSVSN